MKSIKTIFASVVFIALVSVTAFAGTGSKVIAVVNHASWCPACQSNGERAHTAFMENNKDGAIQFIVNDLSTDESKAKSAEELKKNGLDIVMAKNNGTGVAYFFDAETKKLINQISVAKPDQELAEALATAKKGLK
jgi:predicted Fe-Mo cluster-binding NifX family protein